MAALLCVLANAFFVAAEFALARVRPTSLEALARAGNARAVHALTVCRRLNDYLSATQLGITLASLGLGWVGEPALASLIRPPLSGLGLSEVAIHGVAAAIAFALISLLHIVLGEVVPKSFAIFRPEQVTLLTVGPMTAFFYAMYPVLVLLNKLSGAILRRLGVPDDGGAGGAVTAEEIRVIVEASFGNSDQERLKRELLERVLRATDRPVRALMVPRVDMYTLSLNDSLEQWSETVRKTGFSRYPVTQDGNPDHIVGYIYVKDLLLAQKPAKGGPRALTRDILFVPGSLSVGSALARFQRSNIPIAIVVDEYGGTSGLLTIEDVVEELVGDIQDELDVSMPAIEQREDGTLVVAGTVPVGDLPLEGLELDGKNQGHTVGGFIIEQLGRLAHPGDRIQIGPYEATVEDVRRRRIWRVALRLHQPSVRPSPRPSSIPTAASLPPSGSAPARQSSSPAAPAPAPNSGPGEPGATES
jgi:CBS domain containing-hemolysin-like protein